MVAACVWMTGLVPGQLAATARADDGAGGTGGAGGVIWHELKVDAGLELRYQLLLPPAFDPTQPTPTVLALPPGAQDEQMVQAGLDRYWAKEASSRGWVVIAPAAPTGKPFTREGVRAIGPLLREVGKRVLFEGGRVHLVGVSNGGRSAFRVAGLTPWNFHSVTVLPGEADAGDPLDAAKLVALPVAMFVGGADEAWVAASRQTRTKLEKAGVACTLEELPGQGHVLDLAPARLFDMLDTGHAKAMAKLASAPQRVAVVELFTSEGCSSCPPADDVLAELAQRDLVRLGTVLPLAFHVDYWDRLGWKDRFATAENTRRQHWYAQRLKDDSVYTPEVVVNGKVGFVGSNASRLRSEIERELAPATRETPHEPALSVRVALAKDGGIVVEAVLAEATPGELVQAALVENGLKSVVTAGENSGHTLTHERVVRDWASVTLRSEQDRGAQLRLTLPKGAAREKCSIVVFVQSAKDGVISTAVAAEIPPETK
jgi:hypothetical protein